MDPSGDVEARQVGELHVKEDDVRRQVPDCEEGRCTVGGLADDAVARGFEEGARLRPEAIVIVHDE